MNLFKRIESLSTPISLRHVCCLLLVICGALFFAPLPARAQEVNIPDTNLRTVLEKALGKDAGAPITQAEMETLTSLDGSSGNISNLSGIELAKNLTDLSLFNNQLSDISPLAGLTNLRNLSLSYNQLSDISPLAGLTNLTDMGLGNNQVSDISPLAGLTNLTRLYLDNNQLSDISHLAGLTNLPYLYLSNNQVSDISHLAGLTNLRDLRLSNNQVSDISHLAGLTNLTRLWLSNNPLSDISHLAGLTNLTYLNLGNNQVSDISPLAGLTNLRDLRLDNNPLSDISPLAGLTNLTFLNLDNNQVSDRATLARLTTQTVVYFTGNPAFNTPGPKIEGPWLWTLAPTGTSSGFSAASSGKDFLSEASGGSVTEVSVAANGATVSGVVGDKVWTLGSLASTGNDNVTDLVNTLGLGTDISYPVAYGVISVESPRAQNTRLYVGNGGPVKVWLNSASVHVDALGRYNAGDYLTAFPVTLQQGENRLFVSVYRGFSSYPWSGFFGFEAGTEYTVLEPQRGQAADVNGDGSVTVADLALVALFYGRTLTPGASLAADANGDGVVDIKDVILVAGEIDAAAGAPALSDATPHTLPENLTPENLAHWIHLAKQIEALDAHTQNGIRVLEKLLEVLTLSEVSPKETALLANYPNPFNPETWIPYHLARPSEVTVSIYAVDGALVRSLAVGHQPAGVYHGRSRAAYWDGKNGVGEPVASGVYFYTLTAGDFTATRKMLIRK